MTIKSIERALRDEKHVILCRAGRGYYHLYRDAICVGYMYSHLTDWGGVRLYLNPPYFNAHTAYNMSELRNHIRYYL